MMGKILKKICTRRHPLIVLIHAMTNFTNLTNMTFLVKCQMQKINSHILFYKTFAIDFIIEDSVLEMKTVISHSHEIILKSSFSLNNSKISLIQSLYSLTII